SNQYDVVVCGAGPAGLMAACTLGRKVSGARRILLLDKKEPWKEPIFCAEAVSTNRLKGLWPIDRSWVRQDLSGIYFTSRSRRRAEFYSKDCGLLLDRSKFHKSIADECVKAGVECHFDTVVKKLDRQNDEWSITVSVNGTEEILRAPVVVDASGPGARLTKNVACLEGIESGDTDLEPAIFAVAEGIEHSPEHIELFFGSDFPGGYGWIFPRDGKEVNIGFVLGKDAKLEISNREKLMNFLAEEYPQAKVKAVYGGMIACGQSDKPIAKCGLFKAGDSASCVNPISRSGITESLLCGKIVGESAFDWLNAPVAERPAVEDRAHRIWMEKMGKSHMQIARGKAGFNQITDVQFNKAAERLSKLPREKQTLFRIFFNVLWASPSLVWKLRSFLHW
ncbi:MAG: NAD(P)/FAD-dependent oxidoreductase, partial [Fibrobacter sp.]|nr:NAD(P)/FAD-dependent oxidoreductase [Fibrobacter sp.]